MKIIAWWSGGVTSAVAVKKVLEWYPEDTTIIYFDTGNHHKDHERFKKDCEKWYGQKIVTFRNQKYKDALDVCEKDKYINGPTGARCTLKMKKEVRWQIEKFMDFDAQVFGFEFEKKQINRAIRFQE